MSSLQSLQVRALKRHEGVNLALKATVEGGSEDDFESSSLLSNEGLKLAYNEHLALAAKGFWENPSKARAQFYRHPLVGSPQGGKRDISKARTCYNCQDKFHFVAECPYEKREENGGRLILKDKSKMPPKKAYVKNKRAFFKKKAPRIVLMTQEEYPTEDEDESEEEETPNEVAAIATTSTTTATHHATSSTPRTPYPSPNATTSKPRATVNSSSSSLFDSPNENSPNKSVRCLMAKASEVPSSSTSLNDMNELDDAASLQIKEELVAFDSFMANLQGDSKKHVGALMSRIGELEHLIEKKGKIEREDAITIAHLQSSLRDIEESHVRLEEELENMEESHNSMHSKLVKERDLYVAKNKLAQKDKADFVAGHVSLVEDMEKLVNVHAALESEHELLKKSHDQLQTRLTNLEKPSTSTPICTCDHANIMNENVRLKEEIAKASSAKIILLKGKNVVKTPIYEPQSRKGKEGLGYVRPGTVGAKKTIPAQAKVNNIASGNATRGKPTRNDFAGDTNPNYALYVNYYGNVCARYIGPFDGFIAYSIWVPKTLVANLKAPIVKQWVPKVKN